MPPSKDPPLDEVQWRALNVVHNLQGIHTNSVLIYFSESPFFDPQSNNGVYARQATFNQSMANVLFNREQFEHVLSQMPNGVEFRVAQAPADPGPNGTGVWVIVKQERERGVGVAPAAHYMIIGESVYQAPTFGSIMSSKIETMAESMLKVLPAVDSVQSWTASLGNVYQQPLSAAEQQLGSGGARSTSKEATPMPMPEATASTDSNNNTTKATPSSSSPFARNADQTALDRLAEESFGVHMRYGGDYIDENPITGRPGEFHLSSTGRKEKALQLQQQQQQPPTKLPEGPSMLNTKLAAAVATAENAKKEGKADKSPRTPGSGKPKRRKSKMTGTGGTNTAASTPSGS